MQSLLQVVGSPIVMMAALGVGMATFESSAWAQRGRDDSAAFGWTSDYSSAKAMAKKTGKPLMVVFRCIP